MSSPAPYGGKGYLRRSMSTRPIRRGSRTPRSSLCSEPFDVDDAKHQATVAASLAMRRSAERSSTDSRRSYDSLGGPSSMAVPRRYHRSNYTQDRGDYTPARKPIAREVESEDNDKISLATLPLISEFGGLDGRNASLPSSYRRLRRSRSMFAPRQRLSHMFYGNPYLEDGADQALGSSLSRGSLRRSMSFLRGGTRSSHPIRHVRSHEAAIQLARSEFEKNNLGHNTRSRHSSLFSLRPRRDYKPFRKTFRSTSTSGVDPYDTPSSAERYRSTPSFGRARSFSSSIKRGIKRVLGWNHSKPPCDPAQLQSSPCQSFDHKNSSPHSTHFHHDTEISEEEATQFCAVRGRSSFESLATSSSRVTSWADSTVANTITTRRPGEQSHLSIIHERATSSQNLSQPASADYLQRRLTSTPSPSKHSPPIDSQRLYTALMRKIGGSGARGSEEEIVFGRVKEHRAIPTRASSVYPRGSRQTIRPVPSDESILSQGSFTTAPANIGTPQASRVVFEQKMADNDTGSVIFATPEGLQVSPGTSSVYSRSVTGNSPASKEKTADTELPGPEDEPGVATIFEIKRTTYCSPKRASLSPANMPIRPSVDWQQWMNTQMQQFDKGVTVRDHYREEAQIHREETDLAHACHDSSTPRMEEPDRSTPAPVDNGALFRMATNNNFSRPFSRPSSVRTVIVPQKEPEKAAIPSSTSTSPNYAGPNAFSVSRTRPRSNAISLSPIHPKPGHRFAPPESPSPKRSLAAVHPRLTVKLLYGNQIPRLSPDGRALSLRSARSYRDITKRTNENVRSEPRDYKDLYTQSQQNNSPMSSKRMVEMFLNSRRPQMGTEVSDGSVSEDAFV
ncbi:hypothetical protein BJX96DRAFT_116110 [Aspergillus floccosus]